MRRIARPIESASYAPYGQLVAPRPELERCSANQGTAQRFLDVVDLVDTRSATARPHLSIYRCAPWAGQELQLSMLERHACSTQVFMPMAPERYLVVVALGLEQPDPLTLKAFVVQGPVGVSYRPGVWHHPMIALSDTTDFLCLVLEDGSDRDCEEFALGRPLTVGLGS